MTSPHRQWHALDTELLSPRMSQKFVTAILYGGVVMGTTKRFTILHSNDMHGDFLG